MSNCSVETFLLPGNPTTLPFFCLCSINLLTLNPFGTIIDPLESLAPIHLAPIFSRYSPEKVDAFPNPCNTTLAPLSLIFKIFADSLTQYAVPNPVATFLASEPPIGIGFPVITPGEYLLPFILLQVSIICVISFPVV